MKKAILLFLFFPAILSAQSTVNDSLPLKASLGLSGYWQGGNVEALIFRANSEISFRPWGSTEFETKNSYVYQAFGGDKADEDVLSLNFLNLNTNSKLSPLILGFVSKNYRREIDLRYLVGGGARLKIYQENKNWLKASFTIEYEHTDFKRDNFNLDEYDGTPIINTFRTTIWASGNYHLLKEKLVFKHESFVQPSLEGLENFRWRFDLGLEIPLKKYLNFKVTYTDTFESVVIEGQKREDSFLTAGFSLKNF